MTTAAQPLLERDEEIRRLVAALECAAAGSGRSVVVRGTPGIGKTTLLRHAAAVARGRGQDVLWASGAELEADFAFGVARRLLLPHLLRLRAVEREAVLAGPAARAAEVLLHAPPSPEEAAGAAALHPRLDALHWLVAALAAETPLVLVVDDAHWADAASLAWLAFLARRVEDHRVGLLVGIRTSEVAVADHLRAVEAAAYDAIEPVPLSPMAVRRVVEDETGRPPEEAFVRACAEATGGNPFLLAELVRALAAEGVEPVAGSVARVEQATPRTVADAIRERLRRRSPAAIRVAEAVAVLGDGARVDDVAALACTAPEEAVRAIAELDEAAILEDAMPLRFVHPLVRASVYEGLGGARRAAAHRRAAVMLHARGAEPEEVAAQLLGAHPGEGEWAATILLEVGRRAAARGASMSAISQFERAAAEPLPAPVRATILGELGVQQVRAARASAAVGHLETALELVADATTRSKLHRELAFAHLSVGRFDAARVVVERAIAELQDSERELALRLEAEMLVFGYFVDALRRPMQERAAARGDVLAARTPGERLVLAARAFLLWGRGRPSEQTELAVRAMAGGRLFLEQTADGPLAYMTAYQLLAAERYDELGTAVETALADVRVRGSVVGSAAGLGLRAGLHQQLGRIRDAQADGEASLRAALEIDWVPGRPTLVLPLVRAHLDAGDLAAARDVLRRAGYDGRVPRASMFLAARTAQAEVALAEGRPADALATGILDDTHLTVGAVDPKAVAAEALRRTGAVTEARAMAERAVAHARRAQTPRGLSLTLRTLAKTTSGADSADALEEAVSAARASPARLELARALVEQGAALRRANHRAAAREPLLEGLELAFRCGARALEEQAREELLAAGARPRRAVRSGPDALTASELRVGRLAAEGLSNPEIAQALFLSRKTVEMHLGRAYRKLGIGAREELAEALRADA